FVQRLDDRLRLDDRAIALIVREQATTTAPLINLLPPTGDGILVRLLTDLLENRDHLGQDTFHRTNNRHISLDGLGNGGRINVDVNDLGCRAELGGTIDDPVIETCTDGK